MAILYKVSPAFNIPVTWLTEITQVSAPYFFIDDQRVGPYKLWHHQHHFRLTKDGVEMTDVIHYKLPLGIIGRVLNALYVRKKLAKIFDHRYQVLKRMFNI